MKDIVCLFKIRDVIYHVFLMCDKKVYVFSERVNLNGKYVRVICGVRK